jgi:hypothetical protein
VFVSGLKGTDVNHTPPSIPYKVMGFLTDVAEGVAIRLAVEAAILFQE